MYPDLSVGPSMLSAVVGTVCTLIFGAAAAAFAVPKVADRIIPKLRDDALRDYLPFERILPDGETVLCKDGTLVACIEIGGTDITFIQQDEQEALFHLRKRLFDGIADTKATLRIITTRRRIDIPANPEQPSKVAAEVARRWYKSFRGAYRNTTVIMVSVPAKGNLAQDALADVIDRIRNTLSMLKPGRLSVDPSTSTSGDVTLAGFLGQLTAPISAPDPRGTGDGLNAALAADGVIFNDDGSLLFDSGREQRMASILSMRKLGDFVSDTMSDDLLSVDGECTLVHIVQPLERMKATAVLKQQQRMMSTTHFSSAIGDQYQAAIEMVEGIDDSRGSMANYAFSAIAYGRNAEELKETETQLRRVLIQSGMVPITEKSGAQATWWMTFPTYELWPRIYRFMSHNISHLVTFNRPYYGADHSEWGPGAITYFRTPQRTAFAHQFHVAAKSTVAHSLLIAPTGAGKTTFMQFVCGMATRHKNLRTYFFDRFQGTYIYVTAMGGRYLNFNSDRLTKSLDTGLNPFQCDDNEENAAFLRTWLATITGCNDSQSLDQIAQAVALNFHSPRESRSLASLYAAGAFAHNTKLYAELKRWVDPNQYGKIFNAERDTLDVESNRLIAFDMTQLFNDPLLAPAVTSYIMFRISKTMRERREPANIFIDETEPMIRHPEFRKQFLIALQEFRKLGGAVACTFQRPSALTVNDVADAVRGQCQTWYLFPSPGADRGEYETAGLSLTDSEWSFLKGTSAIARTVTRGILIKRPERRETVVIDSDLQDLGPYLKLLSSESKDVGVASELQAKHGDKWVDVYLAVVPQQTKPKLQTVNGTGESEAA